MEHQNQALPGVRAIHSDVAISYSDLSPPKGAAVAFADQNLGANYPTGIAALTNSQTQLVAPQYPVCVRVLRLHYLAEVKP